MKQFLAFIFFTSVYCFPQDSLLVGNLATTATTTSSNSSSGDCIVEEKKSGMQKPCQFPFRMNKKVFNGCTTHKDKSNRPWCSTNVTDDGYHVGSKGFFGYCNLDICKNHTNNTIEDAVDQFIDTKSETGWSASQKTNLEQQQNIIYLL